MNINEAKIRTTDGSVIVSKKYLVCGRNNSYGEAFFSGYDELM